MAYKVPRVNPHRIRKGSLEITPGTGIYSVHTGFLKRAGLYFRKEGDLVKLDVEIRKPFARYTGRFSLNSDKSLNLERLEMRNLLGRKMFGRCYVESAKRRGTKTGKNAEIMEENARILANDLMERMNFDNIRSGISFRGDYVLFGYGSRSIRIP